MPDKWIEESIGRQLYLTSKLARAYFSGRLADSGASFGVWSILAHLHAYGPMIQRELAARLSIEGPTLTRYLAQMESSDLIRRRRSSGDRRAATVEITSAGQAQYRKLEAVAAEEQKHLLAGFSAEEVGMLGDMLARIRRNVGG